MKWIRFCSFGTILALVFSLFTIHSSAAPSHSARAAVVICGDSLEKLYAHNAAEKLPMASTTKIMTALLLAEQPDLSKTVKVTKQMVAVEGSSMGLLVGDTVTYEGLLYGMLLASGNDAANTTAIVLGNTVENFVNMMNRKAKQIGLKNTHFNTPSGLDGKTHYTTAYDLAVLAAYALKNQNFATACSSKSATLYYGNPPYRRTLINHNRLLQNYKGLIGVKTGFTKKAGRCLVTAARRDGKTIIAVTLNDPNDWADHKSLLDYGFGASESYFAPGGDYSFLLPTVSSDCDVARLQVSAASFTVAANSAQKVKKTVYLPPFLFAPLSAGQQVGQIVYKLNGQTVGTQNILVSGDVRRYDRKAPFRTRFKMVFKKIIDAI